MKRPRIETRARPPIRTSVRLRLEMRNKRKFGSIRLKKEIMQKDLPPREM